MSLFDIYLLPISGHKCWWTPVSWISWAARVQSRKRALCGVCDGFKEERNYLFGTGTGACQSGMCVLLTIFWGQGMLVCCLLVEGRSEYNSGLNIK